jgi:hypothetical protein
VFFGLGLFLTPLITSYLFRMIRYEKAVFIIGVIVALPIFVA